MKILRTAYFKKTNAALCIALFVFIHAVKAFHTHDLSSNAFASNTNKNAATVKANFNCAICDFQLAKDSDATITSFNIETPVHYIGVHYYYLLPVSTSFAIASDNKGPPSLA